jgi:hypothetical protein
MFANTIFLNYICTYIKFITDYHFYIHDKNHKHCKPQGGRW